jgi:serine/threonine protein kinase
VSNLQDWNASFPTWFKSPFAKSIVDNIDDNGLELLEAFLAYDPKDRITAKDALNHPFFDDLHKENI